MSAKIISGTEIAKQIREELKKEIVELKERHGVTPGLATVLVGDDPASKVYVGQKEKSCSNLGIYSERIDLSGNISEEKLLLLIEKLNKDSRIHGILVQLPLPKQINESRVICAIDPAKDVDGFHPVNIGKMVIGEKCFLPCTPHGILELLARSGVQTEGAEVVVVGRSNIVGKPVLNLMLQKRPAGNATVTLCHTKTKDLAFHTKRADILIVATGYPKTVTGDMVKEGVVVIDVGVNRIGKTPEGKAILVGDVDFESVKEKAAAITPVPGGVGPMTIVMLMKNTIQAAKNTI
ncbi:MAG: bifunctional methylenetetrahydrofolate dehydrogenase/methenyltetrahydrofolate cyclohydrolase FolD [Desulfobacterales bacterium]|uniref:Bifunctional protein FolD n=1 Tax=Candidatus Desulfaltia bathyphila TaxID=2841697 RepID=A0A8J6T9S7_9BACT|nr:bifunctional methylenetetrahydrofolate dehydrogenase/methenyltetrahydrofolate cyclohydrolase FolD [Candidatus Desulfaltia bathyphila]MBL7194703.1 bifunctional methylenetetrahydrofolate dehydrogenase/methenyltetrahydrofolate cyclohydrolase FolD [Desulfobacterales bacterium]MBL7207329.1 bifunctional methylenetetrahydrofolate dehydrogenase/methenyltetrahydrofolate cyclohydrolase FolD [Desulfobacterales bacterium]